MQEIEIKPEELMNHIGEVISFEEIESGKRVDIKIAQIENGVLYGNNGRGVYYTGAINIIGLKSKLYGRID